jgi:hypothetical protein
LLLCGRDAYVIEGSHSLYCILGGSSGRGLIERVSENHNGERLHPHQSLEAWGSPGERRCLTSVPAEKERAKWDAWGKLVVETGNSGLPTCWASGA